MNAADFGYIEQALGVTLPTPFVNYMERFPNGRNLCFSNGVRLNGELFAIDQLQRFWSEGYGGYDFYELQPYLRSVHFLEIGGDGIGNFFVMRGDMAESDELWLWSHDPLDGFTRQSELSLSQYLDYEGCRWGDGWEIKTTEDPFQDTSFHGTIITRADHPHRSVLKPISLKEWFEFVGRNEFLVPDEFTYRKNPFTGATIESRTHVGRVKSKIPDAPLAVTIQYGRLSLSSSSRNTTFYADFVSRLLGEFDARLF